MKKKIAIPRQVNGKSLTRGMANVVDAKESKARATLHARLKSDRGSSMIELSVVLPVFFLLIMGFIHFSLVMFGLCNVTYATRFSLRYASLHSNASYTPTTAAAINGLVAPFVFQYPDNTESTTVAYGPGGNVVGQPVTVTTTIRYTLNLMGLAYSPAFSFSDQGIIIQ